MPPTFSFASTGRRINPHLCALSVFLTYITSNFDRHFENNNNRRHKNRILTDFGKNADEATEILQEAISKYDYLNNDRIIRCIIFLSEKKLDKLKETINQAKDDPRDVMFWAEYINRREEEIPIRVRDFNKTFQNCEKDVHE